MVRLVLYMGSPIMTPGVRVVRCPFLLTTFLVAAVADLVDMGRFL